MAAARHRVAHDPAGGGVDDLDAGSVGGTEGPDPGLGGEQHQAEADQPGRQAAEGEPADETGHRRTDDANVTDRRWADPVEDTSHAVPPGHHIARQPFEVVDAVVVGRSDGAVDDPAEAGHLGLDAPLPTVDVGARRQPPAHREPVGPVEIDDERIPLGGRRHVPCHVDAITGDPHVASTQVLCRRRPRRADGGQGDRGEHQDPERATGQTDAGRAGQGPQHGQQDRCRGAEHDAAPPGQGAVVEPPKPTELGQEEDQRRAPDHPDQRADEGPGPPPPTEPGRERGRWPASRDSEHGHQSIQSTGRSVVEGTATTAGSMGSAETGGRVGFVAAWMAIVASREPAR